MIHLNSSKNLAPRVLSKSIAGISAVAAAAALMFSAESAHAGSKEFKLLSAALNGNTATASASEIAAAVNSVLTADPKLKPGVVAGEALKLPAALLAGRETVGTQVGQVVAGITGVNLVTATTDAAKTAGTSKGASVLRVPEFAAATLSSDPDAIAAASKAGVPNAVGAILGGRASELANDAAKLALAEQALANKAVASKVTQVAQYVGDQVADTAQFAKSLSENDVQTNKGKSAVKILTGVVTSDPQSAYKITNTFLDDAALATVVNKSLASIAKSVSTVADIEQISQIGSAISDSFNSANLKLTSLSAITKTLVKAIVSKAPGSVSTTGANKTDEIAETAAYVVGGILQNAGFKSKSTTASKLVISILKSAISGAKVAKSKNTFAPDANLIADVVGSVSLTLANGLGTADAALRDAIKAALLKGAKSIAGSSNAAAVTAAINYGFSDPLANTNREDGTLGRSTTSPSGNLASLYDPETDIRTF